MENIENKNIMEYNKIMNYICSLDSFNLTELEDKLATDKGIDYKKIETFILNAVLYLVFCGRLKIEGNRFINTKDINKEIDDEEKIRLLNYLVEFGDDIYLENKQNLARKH